MSNKVTLIPLCAQYSDWVLACRNQARVRENSINERVITLDEHMKFLAELKKDDNQRYFVVHVGDKPVGVLSFTGLDTCHPTWGCYLSQDSLIPGLFAVLISVSADIAFEKFKLPILYSDVIAHNRQPQQMNTWLGIPLIGKRQILRQDGTLVEVLEYQLESHAWLDIKKTMMDKLPSSVRILANSYSIECWV